VKVLVISFSDLARDPRVSRQIDVLAVTHTVTAAGLAAPQAHPNVRFLPLPSSAKPTWLRLGFMALMRVGLYETAYWRDPAIAAATPLLTAAAEEADLIVANDLYALPLALKAAAGRPVLFDAHEYSPEEFADKWWWRLSYRPFYTYLCGRYLSQAAGMMTVCQGIADEYRRHFCVTPSVVLNSPPYQALEPSSVSSSEVRLVHHGAAIASRRLEQMIAMMAHLDTRFTLDFMLMPTQPAYLEHLKQLAGQDPRIRFLPPVPMRELSQFVSAYDVGVFCWSQSASIICMPCPTSFSSSCRVAWPLPSAPRLKWRRWCGNMIWELLPMIILRRRWRPCSMA